MSPKVDRELFDWLRNKWNAEIMKRLAIYSTDEPDLFIAEVRYLSVRAFSDHRRYRIRVLDQGLQVTDLPKQSTLRKQKLVHHLTQTKD